MFMSSVFQNWMDGTAIGASGLCILHCLLLPIVILLLPAMSAASETTEIIHLLSLIIIIPTSLLALTAGARYTGSYNLLLTGCVGLILLVLGALFEETGIWGVALTAAGSGLLIYCHIRNWYRRSAKIC